MAPSPPAPRGLKRRSRRTRAARRLVDERLADVRHARDELTRTLDPEAVHDLRVSTRRLRATLQAFRDLGALKGPEREVKRLQDALGEVRDLHVQGQWLEERTREAPSARRAGFQAMHARLLEPLPQRERKLRRALARWKEHTVPAVKGAARRLEGPGRFGGKRSRRELRHRLRQVKRLMEACDEHLEAPEAHELRKGVKKLRYEAELFVSALGRPVKHLLKTLKPLQEVLGELHDADVRLELLQGFALQGPTAQRAAARLLLETVREERTRHATQVRQELGTWRDEKRAEALRALLD